MKLPIRILLTAAVASATLVACASKTKPALIKKAIAALTDTSKSDG